LWITAGATPKRTFADASEFIGSRPGSAVRLGMPEGFLRDQPELDLRQSRNVIVPAGLCITEFGGHAVASGLAPSTTWMASTFAVWSPSLASSTAPGAPKSKIQFNGVGGLPTYLSFTQGADDMNDEWISCSHWGMFPTGTKYSK
jgi:hypothetical protein